MTRRRHAQYFLGLGLFGGGGVLLLLGGCQSSPQTVSGNAVTPSPLVSVPGTTDVRTEANIIEMENRYIAEKNSQPTRQHEAQAEQKKKEEAAKAAKAAEAEKAAKAQPAEPAKSEAGTPPPAEGK